MSLVETAVTEPIPIPKIAGRYLLFDINVVTYLRRTHNICGVLIGSIPQVPQQNVFLGLPVELLPEEAKLLVEKEVAYIVDEASWHKEKFSTLAGDERRDYLASLRSESRKAHKVALGNAQKRAELGLAKRALLRASKENFSQKNELAAEDFGVTIETSQAEESLFESHRPSSPSPSSSSSASSSAAPFTITPTISYTTMSLPQNASQQPDPIVPSSYPLFAHLHAKDYFITPGLRFGCDYTVYPGDPLRFHSHFLAVGYEWEEEISLIDLIGGGRLGTGVKKGFLIGGKPDVDLERGLPPGSESQGVRTFCIEWGGM